MERFRAPAADNRFPGDSMPRLSSFQIGFALLVAISGALCHNTIPVDELARDLSKLSVEEIRDRMELYIDHRAGSDYVPGAAAALFKEGTPILWMHKGLREDQKVSIASLTKPFTALVAIRLARSGKLDLDAPLAGYLPEWKTLAEKHVELQPITARMLLTHTSGIGYEAADKKNSFNLAGKNYPLPKKKPGSYQYSNFNYHLVAFIIQKVEGKTLTELVQRWILVPAGMKDTTANHSNGAAGMVSTLEDLTRFCEFLLSENEKESSPYYRVFALMKNSENRKTNSEYGLGWHVYAPTSGPDLFFHSGTWYNAAAEIYIIPENRSYFVHLANPPDFNNRDTIRYRSDILKMGRLALTKSE
ncbi:MAG: hypothetical protein CMN76_13340 [Spirochaetaceae bacterium]|nr:hypothetical protein [Spirochaetaceae bacterium]|tara:strand:+ start:7528 stop:8607 length:1080 start_codon:yes stop_codon:yes gene_type:complete